MSPTFQPIKGIAEKQKPCSKTMMIQLQVRMQTARTTSIGDKHNTLDGAPTTIQIRAAFRWGNRGNIVSIFTPHPHTPPRRRGAVAHGRRRTAAQNDTMTPTAACPPHPVCRTPAPPRRGRPVAPSALYCDSYDRLLLSAWCMPGCNLDRELGRRRTLLSTIEDLAGTRPLVRERRTASSGG